MVTLASVRLGHPDSVPLMGTSEAEAGAEAVPGFLVEPAVARAVPVADQAAEA